MSKYRFPAPSQMPDTQQLHQQISTLTREWDEARAALRMACVQDSNQSLLATIKSLTERNGELEKARDNWKAAYQSMGGQVVKLPTTFIDVQGADGCKVSVEVIK